MKKSFVLHKDSLGVLDELSDEQAGRLFKAIKSYQLGEEMNIDALTRIVFSPFKNQFERDAEKYLRIVERNRTNGKKGGRPKDEEKTDTCDKPNKSEVNPEKPSGLSGNPDEPRKADSDSDSDSDLNKDLISEKSDAEIVLDYLNQVCQTKLKASTRSHIENINARLSDGYTVEDCKAVIDFKFSEWAGTSQAQYLRPKTLFSTSKFTGYVMGSRAYRSNQQPQERVSPSEEFRRSLIREGREVNF